jgi:hypothetical protein
LLAAEEFFHGSFCYIQVEVVTSITIFRLVITSNPIPKRQTRRETGTQSHGSVHRGTDRQTAEVFFYFGGFG